VNTVGGTIGTVGPAYFDGSEFGFPADPGSADDHFGVPLSYHGSALVRAHQGLIDLGLAEPVLLAGTDDVAEVSFVARVGASSDFGRVAVARLDRRIGELAGAIMTGESVPAVLLGAATWLFDHRYPAGTELAPMRWFAGI
jgi:Htaa